MAYEIRRFNAASTRAILSQLLVLAQISLRSFLILSSHLGLGFPKCPFLYIYQLKYLFFLVLSLVTSHYISWWCVRHARKYLISIITVDLIEFISMEVVKTGEGSRKMSIFPFLFTAWISGNVSHSNQEVHLLYSAGWKYSVVENFPVSSVHVLSCVAFGEASNILLPISPGGPLTLIFWHLLLTEKHQPAIWLTK